MALFSESELIEFTGPDPEKPHKIIYVHFESREDMEAFTKLTGKKVDLTVKRIVFP